MTCGIEGGAWWAQQGLNLRPHPCEGCALPLSYAPTRRGSYRLGMALSSRKAGVS